MVTLFRFRGGFEEEQRERELMHKEQKEKDIKNFQALEELQLEYQRSKAEGRISSGEQEIFDNEEDKEFEVTDIPFDVDEIVPDLEDDVEDDIIPINILSNSQIEEKLVLVDTPLEQSVIDLSENVIESVEDNKAITENSPETSIEKVVNPHIIMVQPAPNGEQTPRSV